MHPSAEFVAWCALLGLSERRARRVWGALAQSRDPETKAFLYALTTFAVPRSESQAQAWRTTFLTGVGSPQRIIAMLEHAVEGERVLTWRDANALLEPVLQRMDRHGEWR